MAIKIIGRDGQVRKQGDTSSWNRPSQPASSGSSSKPASPSQTNQQKPTYSPTYQQQNQRLQSQTQAIEAERPTQQVQQIKQVQGSQSSPRYSPAYQQQNERLQQQIKAVEQERPKENTIVNPNIKERTITAFKEGYKAGQGKEYSLARLQAPATSAKEMLTYSFAEKANALSEKIDKTQNAVLKGLPKGTAKDIVTGVSNIPEMTVFSLGNAPLGMESIVRNPSTISDSIALGTGAVAGATVQKAKTHPGELLGEIAGAIVVGKAAGKIEAKTINAESLKSFAADETATLGAPKLIYKAKEPKTVTAPELETHKPAVINKISIADDVKLTPEMEEVLFGKSTIKQPATELETRNIFSPEMTKPSSHHISSIEPKNEISRVTIADDVKLTPEMETVIFRKGPKNEKYTQVETRDIFSPEMTQPTEFQIRSIKGIEKEATKIKIHNPTKTIPVTSAIMDTIPIVGQKIPYSQKSTLIPVTSAITDTIPIVGQKITLKPSTTSKISSPTITKTGYAEIPDTTIKQTPSMSPDTAYDLTPSISPDMPIPTPDPFSNKIPNISPDTPTRTPSFNSIALLSIPDKTISVGLGGLDPLMGSSIDTPVRKRTKHKMTKNKYGDPFSSKTIL